jgi:hypothetical protein
MKNKSPYQWILHHVRATDRVFFGPFESYEELDEFYETIPKAQQIHCCVELLINPFITEDWWFNPFDDLEKKYPELFKRKKDANAN